MGQDPFIDLDRGERLRIGEVLVRGLEVGLGYHSYTQFSKINSHTNSTFNDNKQTEPLS
jgi:hypothetical protein